MFDPRPNPGVGRGVGELTLKGTHTLPWANGPPPCRWPPTLSIFCIFVCSQDVGPAKQLRPRALLRCFKAVASSPKPTNPFYFEIFGVFSTAKYSMVFSLFSVFEFWSSDKAFQMCFFHRLFSKPVWFSISSHGILMRLKLSVLTG